MLHFNDVVRQRFDPQLLIPLTVLDGMDLVGLRVVNRSSAYDKYIVVARVSGERVVLANHDSVEPELAREWLVYLGDAATRDRCLRWLAARVGLNPQSGAGWWSHYSSRSRVGWELAHPDEREHVFDLVLTASELLARLPDGSLLVDAIALGRVILATVPPKEAT